jgi:adenosylcobinamide kinase / adenosylcobinamide-phosphate guanylyltransferase
MGKIIFITGGARSGKSRYAESILSGKNDVLYVATGIGFDEEMKDRIARHRLQRNPNWETVECYRGLPAVLKDRLADKKYVLLDCVTIMISNIMVLDAGIDWDKAGMNEVDQVELNVREEVAGFIKMSRDFAGETLIVSNELGMGIVPDAPLGRYYRDIAGKMNQFIAAEADDVYMMLSGIPMKIK